MDDTIRPVRPILTQPFPTFIVAVQVTPTPIMPSQTRADLINSFVVSVAAAAANNVFIGDQGVTVNSGLEIIAGGGPIRFTITDERMKYELLFPMLAGLQSYQCRVNEGYGVPFIIWDLSQIFLVAPAITNVRVAAFRSQFI